MPFSNLLSTLGVVLLLGCATTGHAQALQGSTAATQTSRQGTWSARAGTSGPPLGGTWTATADPATGAVAGKWTLVDQNGRVLMSGAWSAAKAKNGWTGAWRAAVDGSRGEYSGTWSAKVKLKPDARFAELFESAAKAVVSGGWRANRRSGTWTIRASE